MADPRVSIVLPVRNEVQFIGRCLHAILSQDYPAEAMEVIVADGESIDGTVNVIRALSGSERVRIISNPGRTAPAGLNRAIAQARGDIIVRVDGHAIIAPDYVRQAVRTLKETGAAGVGGCLTPIGTTPMGKAIAAAMTSPFGIPSAYHTATHPQYTDQVYLGAWPRRVFEQIGGFDEQFVQNQDYEFHYRLRKYVGGLYLTPAMRAEYYGRSTLRALARQFYRYGKSKPRTLRRHLASLRPRHLVAPVFVLALLAGPLLAVAFPLARLVLLALLVLYAALDAGYSLVAARRCGVGLFLHLIVVFFLIHLTWGIGFWMGAFTGDKRSKAGRNPAEEEGPSRA